MKKYAIFFPQFHRTGVNDQAWGYGFTDWALVAVANAFGYWSRRSPVGGFYDLADVAAVEKQLLLAAESGLDGFGIYHYWFEDGSELGAVERCLPQIEMPHDFGYFYIWANESWSKRWAGQDTEILKSVSTAPSLEEVRKHVQYLKPYMESASYTHISNRPVFVIYRPEFFKNPVDVLASYRAEFKRAGLNPLIGYCMKSLSDMEYSSQYDFCYVFEPRMFFNFNGLRKSKYIQTLFKRAIHLVPYSTTEKLSSLVSKILNRGAKTYTFGAFLKYFKSSERNQMLDQLSCPVQSVLTCGWNNAPRYRQRYTELQVPSIEEFAVMMQESQDNPRYAKDIPLLCNAWNEWSEGAALEPCHYLGTTLLDAYLNKAMKTKVKN